MESWSVRVDLSIHASNWCEFKWFGLIQRFSMNSRFSGLSWRDRTQRISASSGTPQLGVPEPDCLQPWPRASCTRMKCRNAEMQRCTSKGRDGEWKGARQGLLELTGQPGEKDAGEQCRVCTAPLPPSAVQASALSSSGKPLHNEMQTNPSGVADLSQAG